MVTMTAMMMAVTVAWFFGFGFGLFLFGACVFYCHCLVCSSIIFSSLSFFYFCLIFAEKLGRAGWVKDTFFLSICFLKSLKYTQPLPLVFILFGCHIRLGGYLLSHCTKQCSLLIYWNVDYFIINEEPSRAQHWHTNTQQRNLITKKEEKKQITRKRCFGNKNRAEPERMETTTIVE